MIRYLLCFVVTLVMMLLVMPRFISYLKKKNINQVTSEYALEEFKQKEKTPIMGGLMFVVIPSIVAVVLNLNGLLDPKFLFVLLSYLLYCSVGFIDDSLVIKSHKNDGLSPKTRLGMEFIYCLILTLLFRDVIPTGIYVPFIGITIGMHWITFFIFMTLEYMAEANAVNFTDGMDGLCAGVSFVALLPFAILSYIRGEINIFIFIICILAGLLGYLKFNFHPAKIFMGDSGSLALGALFASLGVIMNLHFALFIIGGVFVAEMFCVVVQQLSVRLFHKRVFSYTPIHYAFVIKGHSEKRVVLSFYAVELLLAVIGLYVGMH